MGRPRCISHAPRTIFIALMAIVWLGADRSMGDVLPPGGSTTTVLGDYLFPTNDVGKPAWLTETGWNIRELVLTYNTKTDTLDVDIKTTGVAGMAVGNMSAAQEALLKAIGGLDPLHLGGDKSIAVAFAAAGPNHTVGSPFAIAGVPATKNGGGLDGFQLAHYVGNKGGLENSFGSPITGSPVGTLLYDPSLAHPDFEFTITNFSKLAGFDLTKGFYYSAYAGSAEDVAVGEKHIGWTYVGGFTPAGQFTPVPEPASFLLFGVGGIGLIVARRRSQRSTQG